MGLALVFPGQASQAIGMGVDLRRASEGARQVFKLADEITGLPITGLCENGPLDRLTETDVAQPAVVATSLAALAYLQETQPELAQPAAVAGHSVGEISACVAAGALTVEEGLHLVHLRATAMAQACRDANGTMVVVLGLDEEPLREICSACTSHGSSVEVANLNAPGQVVLSGHCDAIARASQAALQAGAKRVLPLNIGGPFHSAYMRPAIDALRQALATVPPHAPVVPVVANVTARPLRTADEIANELSAQVAAPVRWTDSVQTLASLGCDTFLEVGQGQVLAGLVKRSLRGVRAASFGAPDDLSALQPLVASAR